MGVGTIGLMYGGATLAALFSGIPIAFALGGVATIFMMVFMPAASLDTWRRTSMRNSLPSRC